MNAPLTQSMYLCLFALLIATCVASVHNEEPTRNNEDDRKLEIFDGVYMGFPRQNNTGRLFSIEVDTNRSLSEGKDTFYNLINHEKRILLIRKVYNYM